LSYPFLRGFSRIIVFTAFNLLFVSPGCLEHDEDKGSTEEQPCVAMVDGHEITLDDFLRSFKSNGPGADLDPLTKTSAKKILMLNFLDQEVERRVLLEEAKKRNIIVSKQEVDKALSELKSAYKSDNFKLLLLKRGINQQDLKEHLSDRLTIQRLLSSVIKHTKKPINELDVENYYNRHQDEFKEPERARMRQILVPTREEARQIREEILSGLDFTKAAKKYSTTPDSALGGDLGYFERGVMPKIFDEIAFSAKLGKVSDVVESDYGYHLFLVVDRTKPTILPLAKVRDKIRRLLEAKQAEAQRKSFLAEVLSSHKILKQPKVIETFLKKQEVQ